MFGEPVSRYVVLFLAGTRLIGWRHGTKQIPEYLEEMTSGGVGEKAGKVGADIQSRKCRSILHILSIARA